LQVEEATTFLAPVAFDFVVSSLGSFFPASGTAILRFRDFFCSVGRRGKDVEVIAENEGIGLLGRGIVVQIGANKPFKFGNLANEGGVNEGVMVMVRVG